MQQTLGIQQAQIADYLIVISPTLEIMSIANGLKRKVDSIIGGFRAQSSIPHITICKTLLTTDRENKIIYEWQKLLKTIDPFRLKVKGLNVFESSGTVFLETNYPDELKKIRIKFQEKNKELRISKKGYHLISTPHLTICRGLKSNELIKLKGLIFDFNFEKEFLVEQLIGLRADSMDTKYQNSRVFKFKENNNF